MITRTCTIRSGEIPLRSNSARAGRTEGGRAEGDKKKEGREERRRKGKERKGKRKKGNRSREISRNPRESHAARSSKRNADKKRTGEWRDDRLCWILVFFAPSWFQYL